jgi:oxygen-independent coproporphyrinogen-3 oxidase
MLIETGDLARVLGHALTGHDKIISGIIAALLCQFQIRISDICEHDNTRPTVLLERFEQVNARFLNFLNVIGTRLIIPPKTRPLNRLIARAFDFYVLSDAGHIYAT